ncbi:multidrug resistance-associated ABC transporter [Sparassis latifolia]
MGIVLQAGSSLLTLVDTSQAVLGQGLLAWSILPQDETRVFLGTLFIPAYVATISVVVLLFQLVLCSSPVKKLHARFTKSQRTSEENDCTSVEQSESFTIAKHVQQLGGPIIFGFQCVRLLSCLVLLGLSVFASTFEGDSHWSLGFVFPQWQQNILCGTYAYASLLAVISVSARPTLSRVVARHLATVLLTTWAVFVYRDVWPLATYTLTPADVAEGRILWAKFSVLTLGAVAVPLLMPRQYTPVDSMDPMPVPNPEQTASILSLILYTWLDPTVFTAYRVPHLPLERLPPLADYDYTSNLIKKSFPHLDPFQVKSRRHIFFGLMRIFRIEYCVMATMLGLRVVVSFASPLGINLLLRYLETNGEGAVVRSWVWISWLLLGPIVSSMLVQWYIFMATRTLVRVEGILTSLVFDHSLRIRVKAEVSGASGGGGAGETTAVATPDNGSIVGPSESRDTPGSPGSSEDATVHSSSDSVDTNSAVGKRNSKTSSHSGDSKKTDEKPASEKGGNLVGKINNLVTTDLNNVTTGRDFLLLVVEIPLQVVLCVWFLYSLLGWSALCGMIVMVICFPLPGYLAILIQKVQAEKMKKTDARVQSVTEIMSVIRMIKLFGWEPRVVDQLLEKRDDELLYQKKSKILELSIGMLNHFIPLLTMMVTYATFTVIMKRNLSASIVFSSMTVFEMLANQLHAIFGMLPAMIRAKVSLDRVNEFLYKTELLDQFTEKTGEEDTALVISKPDAGDMIGFRDAAFTWSADNDGTLTPGPRKRNFTLRIEDELLFKRGRINLIVGPTGSGKTSLIMALLGEMHYIPSGPESFFNLPRSGGIAYAAQESWVQNETIQDNIIFGAPYDEERYNQVIEHCGLKRDLSLFDAGDKTEVGEKGLTLSGGQKARITLARAVYSNAEILLLDDVLAALDVHTARWIVEKCFQGDLIRGRTVILVTHNVSMARPIADFVVSLGTDGRILSQGSLSKALEANKKLSAEVVEEIEEIEKAEHEVDQPPNPDIPANADGKLIVAEEISEGHVEWPALKMFFANLSGGYHVLFWFALLGSLLSASVLHTLQAWWLGYWARQYEDHDASDIHVSYYLSMYAVVLLGLLVLYCAGYLAYVFGTLRASRSVHQLLVSSVLGTTLRWLDVTPTSRIIARCTEDIQSVDGTISEYFWFLLDLSFSMAVKLAAVVIMSPIFIIPGVLIALLGGLCGQIYMKAQLSVKREKSNARAPVLGHFGAAISGLTSIRAYGAEESFKLESARRVNRNTRASRTFYNLNRWVCIRIESLGALFAASLATYLVYVSRAGASATGFSLNMAISFSDMILWWVRIFNDFEVSGNSLERIQQYVIIEQELKASERGIPPAYWPASGDLTVENLSARYSPDGPLVLYEISFEVKSGERVGIVGRTGSGKSSLTLALLRCILTEGKVYFDGIPTDTINLDALRSHITIIPQVPELLSGTLRQNLDPFQMHDDAVLNDALRTAGLFSVQSDTDDDRITLDTQISSAGGNLSVGQRQILALARAIVRQSKLLILDEATSAIDYHTDTVIQTSLRKELSKDVTLLTIAHRLQTIMDADKIMVLDAGHIAEFGKPSELLQNEKGMLRALVDESGDRDALYAMAQGAGASSADT